MDRSIQLCEIEPELEPLFRDVESGESYVVISNGVALARIVPWTPPTNAVRNLLDFVEALPTRHHRADDRASLYD